MNDNLQIVNGWLVEDTGIPNHIPGFGDEPGSELSPLVNLTELPGWPGKLPIADEMVERAAIQMCANEGQPSVWAVLTDSEKDEFRGDARAALEAALGGAA